jgi:hypothetical protein
VKRDFELTPLGKQLEAEMWAQFKNLPKPNGPEDISKGNADIEVSESVHYPLTPEQIAEAEETMERR